MSGGNEYLPAPRYRCCQRTLRKEIGPATLAKRLGHSTRGLQHPG